MAVSQSQVDQIIASASSDDPEVKLLQLQDEVDLIKTSIKRLLIDIRERLNDLENPIVSSMANAFHDTSSDTEAAKNENRTSTDVKKRTRLQYTISHNTKERSRRNKRTLPNLTQQMIPATNRSMPRPRVNQEDTMPNFLPR